VVEGERGDYVALPRRQDVQLARERVIAEHGVELGRRPRFRLADPLERDGPSRRSANTQRRWVGWRLNNKSIFTADIFQNFDENFHIGKVPNAGLRKGNA
jgi:hypothetical protein